MSKEGYDMVSLELEHFILNVYLNLFFINSCSLSKSYGTKNLGISDLSLLIIIFTYLLL